MRPNTTADFWKRVRKDGPVPPHRPELGPCWPWTGAIQLKGGPYGRFSIGDGTQAAHRYAYEQVNGTVPPGLQVLHRCDNPPCCNNGEDSPYPSHLFAGTHQDNMDDRDVKGRTPRGERVGLAKLTESDVRIIRAECANGSRGTAAILATRLGVSDAVISAVVRGKTWRHVKQPIVPEQLRFRLE